ncbi:Mov34/MPN/PAD-1 family protein [Salegentibacter sp. JZCK2]|uniref:Mov34/MPN/PAD-1 family protein n=1 Tax=Salegentibacter tibetensis TaxID=2873600 RepID=UPI001CCDDD78|nr:Mov34/MPN/PAD-1 family protein [Salegentibacter tibetensis]MBZ9731344.1 Mov34/MPN/PAD-1 family protein [Salegentibacter tibetensis]
MNVIWIRSDLYEDIIGAVKTFLPYETGGILLGYVDVQENLVVTKIVDPGPEAVHRKDYFLPDGSFQQKEIDKVFQETEGEETYLGDWHSHPYKRPFLSDIDLDTLQRIATHKPSGTDEPVFLIVGTNPLKLKCWQYSATKHEPIGLEIRIWTDNL